MRRRPIPGIALRARLPSGLRAASPSQREVDMSQDQERDGLSPNGGGRSLPHSCLPYRCDRILREAGVPHVPPTYVSSSVGNDRRPIPGFVICTLCRVVFASRSPLGG